MQPHLAKASGGSSTVERSPDLVVGKSITNDGVVVPEVTTGQWEDPLMRLSKTTLVKPALTPNTQEPADKAITVGSTSLATL